MPARRCRIASASPVRASTNGTGRARQGRFGSPDWPARPAGSGGTGGGGAVLRASLHPPAPAQLVRGHSSMWGCVGEERRAHARAHTNTNTNTNSQHTRPPHTHTQLRKHTLTIPIQPRPGAAWAGPGGGQRRTPAHPPVTTRAESPPDRRPVANCSRPHRPNASAAPGCSHPRAAGRAAVSLRRRRLTGVGGRGRKPAPAAAAAGTG